MNVVKRKYHNGELKLVDIILYEKTHLRLTKLTLICQLKRDSKPNRLRHTYKRMDP